jgi:hypothetical protein
MRNKVGKDVYSCYLGISLGLWRWMSIFFSNMLFAIEKHISVSDLSSKMNR